MPDTPDDNPVIRDVTVACPKCGREHTYHLDVSGPPGLLAIAECKGCHVKYTIALAFDVALWRPQRKWFKGPLKLAK